MLRLRRRIVKAVSLSVILYLFIWIAKCVLNGTSSSNRRYPKAIVPNEGNIRELQTAIIECKSVIMYEEAPSKCTGIPLILLLVVSSPNNILHRFILRKYLASEPPLPSYNEGPAWRMVFVISRTNNPFLEKKIKHEIAANRDVILGRYRDNKKNLVYKVITGLGWAACSCRPKYLLKVHDDVFVNLRIIVNWLFERTNGTFHDKSFYTGISTTGHIPRPIRIQESELFVSKDVYPHETYAPYIIGAAYLISADVLLMVTPLIARYSTFSAEDAYFGMLARKVGVLPQDNRAFIRHAKPHTWSTCNYRRILVSIDAMTRDLPKMFVESLWSEKKCLPVATLFPEPNITKVATPSPLIEARAALSSQFVG